MKTLSLTMSAAIALSLLACSNSGGEGDGADKGSDSTQVADASQSSAEDENGRSEEDRAGDAAEATEKDGKLDVTLPDGVTSDMLGERDPQMIAVQVMLDRSPHSPGVVDGRGGGNTNRAIRYYRQANGLSSGTAVDRELLRSLLETEGGDVFRTYTLTQADVDGPFYSIPSGFAEKAKLEKLGFENVREMLGERFHMDQDFLMALNPNADFSKAGTKLVITSRGNETLEGQIAKIEVRKGDNTLAILNGSGKVVASYPATIGSGDFPSPSGSMTVNTLAPAPNYTFDPDDLSWGPSKTFVLPAGPNNPVGGTWIDLSKDGYGIHGSPDPQLIGKTASHGCVRLTNWDAEELGKAIESGIPVVFV